MVVVLSCYGDKGTWQPIMDSEQGFKKGKLIFHLLSKKLKGGWILLRMNTSGAKRNWLLLKKPDEHTNLLSDHDLLNIVSVKTHRNFKEIANKKYLVLKI